MQSTLICHGSDGRFEPAEPGIYVRDLGIGDATGGEYSLSVIRIEPEGARVEQLHRHDEGFSLAYVLKGWLDVEFQEIGVQHLGPGAVVPAFNAPTHRELDAGEGLELLLLVTQRNLLDHDREKIVVQQESEVSYQIGERGDFLCRDFGLRDLTGGRMAARAIQAVPGARRVGEWHCHAFDFQFVYVAEGWLEAEFEDVGKVRIEKGAVASQRPRVPHVALDHSDDLLLIEVVSPAEYRTEAVPAPTP